MSTAQPLISVVVLNYNGARWTPRCLDSLKAQTLFPQLEIIVADNASSDGSDRAAEEQIKGWPRARFIQNGGNLGFALGNNRGAAHATGEWLFILNNDAWLEPDCLEVLLRETTAAGAAISCPLVLNYDDDSFQSLGAAGLDLFGLPSTRFPHADTREVLMPEGCAWLVRRADFEKLGGLDAEFFLYSEEYDLALRAWVHGLKIVAVPAARMHHRGAANVNPAGGGQVVEFRTSDSKRFYANRNALLALLKNGQHLLLLMAALQLGLLLAESLVALVLIRRWAFVRRGYVDAVTDLWRLRKHICAERRRIGPLRQRGDFWLLRFFKLRLNRWDELQRTRRYGLPKVTAQ